MREEDIKSLIKVGILRIRQIDKEKIKSSINSVEITVKVVKKIHLNEDSATLIFREMYESIRQLGDSNWWLLGYEPQNHEISLEILKDIDIKEKVKLNFLERFKKIRHDANYRGFRTSVSQAREILDFWDKCGKEILKKIQDKL